MNDLKKSLLLLLSCVLSGCGPDDSVREYEVKREQEEVLMSDVLRDQFESMPFRWTAPADWKASKNDQFSAFAWTAGPDDASARITVSELPGTAGIEPQFVRWRGQLQLPPMDASELMKSVETISLRDLTGQWIEIKGDSESILGMISAYKGKLWVFKYRSPNSTAMIQREPFRKFCESLATE